MTQHAEGIHRERREGVTILTIDRPATRNAIDPATARLMSGLLDEADADDDVRVVVLTASGDYFCAGADLKHHAVAGDHDLLIDGKGFGGLTERYFTKPLICAVNGNAYGGGYELVLACDLAVAFRGARFSLPEATLGLLADGGALIRLQNRVALPVLLEMAFTGLPLTAERAHDLGLVNRLVDDRADLLDAALELAAQVMKSSQTSLLLSKRLAYRALAEHESTMWHLNETFKEAVGQSADYWEGPLAWVEHRSPDFFSGRGST